MPASATAAEPAPGTSSPAVLRLLIWLTAAGIVSLAGWLVASRGRLVDHERPPAAAVGFSLDINSAPAAELAQLPGIGPALAGRIIAHRRKHGPFPTLEAVAAVNGIGPVTLRQIAPFIRPLRGRRTAADEETI